MHSCDHPNVFHVIRLSACYRPGQALHITRVCLSAWTRTLCPCTCCESAKAADATVRPRRMTTTRSQRHPSCASLMASSTPRCSVEANGLVRQGNANVQAIIANRFSFIFNLKGWVSGVRELLARGSSLLPRSELCG